MFNGRSLAYLKDKGLASACVSFELRFAQIRDMPKVLPAEAIVYGLLPLMITENCLVQNAAGCRRDREGPAVPADGPCRSQQLLRDRTGAAFPLLPAFGHRTEIQNSRPLLRHGICGGMRRDFPGLSGRPLRRRGLYPGALRAGCGVKIRSRSYISKFIIQFVFDFWSFTWKKSR